MCSHFVIFIPCFVISTKLWVCVYVWILILLICVGNWMKIFNDFFIMNFYFVSISFDSIYIVCVSVFLYTCNIIAE